MQFVIFCLDKPDSRAARMANRPAHLAFIEREAARVRLAGPLLAEDGETMIGSLIVIEADSREEAEAFSAADPYRQNGVFGAVRILAFRTVLPKA